jgi:hypothetical protein
MGKIYYQNFTLLLLVVVVVVHACSRGCILFVHLFTLLSYVDFDDYQKYLSLFEKLEKIEYKSKFSGRV